MYVQTPSPLLPTLLPPPLSKYTNRIINTERAPVQLPPYNPTNITLLRRPPNHPIILHPLKNIFLNDNILIHHLPSPYTRSILLLLPFLLRLGVLRPFIQTLNRPYPYHRLSHYRTLLNQRGPVGDYTRGVRVFV